MTLRVLVEGKLEPGYTQREKVDEHQAVVFETSPLQAVLDRG